MFSANIESIFTIIGKLRYTGDKKIQNCCLGWVS